MTITRVLHIEQDVNNALQIQVFPFEADAILYSKSRVLEAINRLLGDEYVIPPKHIDADGYIEHFGHREEISSSEWAWYVYDGVCNTIRGYIEEIAFDVDAEGSSSTVC